MAIVIDQHLSHIDGCSFAQSGADLVHVGSAFDQKKREVVVIRCTHLQDSVPMPLSKTMSFARLCISIASTVIPFRIVV